MANKQPRPGQAGLRRKVAKWFRCREKGREQYAAADELLDEIRQSMKPGEVVVIPKAKGRKAVVSMVDNYAQENKVFRSHGINRFELKTVREITA